MFLKHSVIILFLCPIVWQFSKNNHFQKKGAEIRFFKFLSFKFIFWKLSFLCWLKHYKNRFQQFFCVFVAYREEEKRPKKKDNWNFWIWQRWPFRDAYLFFKKCLAETLVFIVFLCARFWAKLSKKEILDTHQKKKNLTDNWNALFFPLKRAFLFIFECLALFLLCLLGLPLFHFLFLCLSLSLSCLSSFLLVFLFCIILVPCFGLFLYFCLFFAFVSWKEQQNIKLQVVLFINPFFWGGGGVLSSFFFQIPFPYLCFFSWF